MNKFKATVRLAVVSVAAFGMAAVAAEARDIKVQRKAVAAASTAQPAEIAANTPVAWTAAPVAAAPAAAAEPAVPACARKVKVIYAGYGEATRAASCTLASNEPSK